MTDFYLKNDEELFLLIQEDFKPAFLELVDRWSAKLYDKSYKRIQDNAFAITLVKEILNELWENRTKLKIKKISDYLVGTLKLKLLLLNDQKMLPGKFAEPLNHIALAIIKAEAVLSLEDIKGIIEQWIITQPDERVQVFNLKYKAKFTSKEVSEKLRIPVNIVNDQLKISRISLNDYVQKFIAMNLQ